MLVLSSVSLCVVLLCIFSVGFACLCSVQLLSLLLVLVYVAYVIFFSFIGLMSHSSWFSA